MLLAGKSCVITGAGSGVGRASAIVFAREGAKVVCADIMDDWAKETVRLVEEQGGTAAVAACDVTKEDDVQAAIATAVLSFGRLDVMFNNAGVSTPAGAGTFETYDDAAWERLMSINLRGVFYGMKHAILQFKGQGTPGAIVNTGSAAGMVGWGGTVYGTTKGGVIQMTRAVAVEAAPFDIRVNAICPAAMPTTNFGVHDPSQAFQPKPDQFIAGAGQFHPLGRIITPEDCAEAAAFLASDRSRNITGVLLPVDGGYTAR
jgi:NAD(P)-dependent dehydrogenase (short-subunit alcohol dehydrogenase family)